MQLELRYGATRALGLEPERFYLIIEQGKINNSNRHNVHLENGRCQVFLECLGLNLNNSYQTLRILSGETMLVSAAVLPRGGA